ncbi:inorganic diphosphatase [Desmophyllum pertusum]|uniref:Inorganic pyrophosphatase n=1 Tax=Desmophyllum pertusum TaxID=174260 RepID=A0A9W9Y7I5_9CNID|nr:inorganic diphosphatase [Desmophyllum pertusum]
MARFLVTSFLPLASFGRGILLNFGPISARRTSPFASLMKRTMSYSTYESGAPNTLEFRMYFRDNKDQAISPFHDIPLFANDEKTICNMVVEVPRWTNAKMEISTKEALNPIKQDCKKGKLRFVHNCFPYHGYIWNYGALPQTWEDPNHKDPNTECMGDSDPIDACEIGTMIAQRGDVKQVKILGTVALIDEGETDWKVFCIDVNDPLAKDMNDIDDIEKYMPGLLKASVDWFKIYKIPAGSGENKFAFNDEAKSKEFAMKIVNETHECWRKLVLKEVENTTGIACKNVTVDNSPYKLPAEEATGILKHAADSAEAHPIDAALEVDRWHYVNAKKPKL